MNNQDIHHFKKSLGQNFLRNKSVAKQLIADLSIEPNETIVEIGPGQGSLTSELIRFSKELILVEKDNDLIFFLNSKFPGLRILNMDFLQLNLEDVIFNKKYTVIGSLPYNVSKKIIYKLLTSSNPPQKMGFIIQKEVAKEYSAKPPKATLLSNFANIYSTVKLGKVIPAKAFYPIPKVDGQIITFTQIIPKVEMPLDLYKFIRIGFSFPRKILASNLHTFDKIKVKQILEQMNLSTNIRASELTLPNWISLKEELNNDTFHFKKG